MARARSRAIVRGGRAQRSPTTWARQVSIGTVVVPAATKVLLTTVVLSNPGINETIRRTRGYVSISGDQTGALEVMTGAFGAVVVSDLAIAAGAASIPGPVTDASDDGWFVWRPFSVRQDTSAVRLGSQEVFDFDSKGMRRIEEGFGVAFMAENASPTFGYEIMLAISILTSLT